MTAATEESAPQRCPNCLELGDGKFCSRCGSRYQVSASADIAELASLPDVGRIGKLINSLFASCFNPAPYTIQWIAGARSRYVSPTTLFFTIFSISTLALLILQPNPLAGSPASIATVIQSITFGGQLFPDLAATALQNPDLYAKKLRQLQVVPDAMYPVSFAVGVMVALIGVRGWSLLGSIVIGLVEGTFMVLVVSIGALDDLVLKGATVPTYWFWSGLAVPLVHMMLHINAATGIGLISSTARSMFATIVTFTLFALSAYLTSLLALFPIPLIGAT